MQISEFLSPDDVICDRQSSSKRQLLQDLSTRAARLSGLPGRRVFDVLTEREKLGSTGIGHGTAVPHGRFEDIEKILGLFAQLAAPVDWESDDGQPVDLVFLLMVPSEVNSDHLQALARISGRFRLQQVRNNLRAAKSAEEIYQLLTAEEAAL